MPDPVNHPEHYTKGGIECIDAIEAMLTPEEFEGMLKGNALKYIWRERHKAGNESIEKAIWYLKRLIETRTKWETNGKTSSFSTATSQSPTLQDLMKKHSLTREEAELVLRKLP